MAKDRKRKSKEDDWNVEKEKESAEEAAIKTQARSASNEKREEKKSMNRRYAQQLLT